MVHPFTCVCGSCVADIVSREKMAVKKGIVVNSRVTGFSNLCKGIGTRSKIGNSYLPRLGEILSNIKKTLWESIGCDFGSGGSNGVGLSDICLFHRCLCELILWQGGYCFEYRSRATVLGETKTTSAPVCSCKLESHGSLMSLWILRWADKKDLWILHLAVEAATNSDCLTFIVYFTGMC